MIILVEAEMEDDDVTDALDERVATILGAVMNPGAMTILLMKVHLEEVVSDALRDALRGSLEEDLMVTSAATIAMTRGTMEDRIGDQGTAVDLAKGQGQGLLADLLQAPTVVADLVDAQGPVADPLEAQAIPRRSIVLAITKSFPSTAAIHVTGGGWGCQRDRGIAPARVPARDPTHGPIRVVARGAHPRGRGSERASRGH